MRFDLATDEMIMHFDKSGRDLERQAAIQMQNCGRWSAE
jgi:hypothetical protein